MPREPALRNTCRDPRTSLPQRAFHPTDNVQQDIHPTDYPPPSARKNWAGEVRRRGGLRRGRIPSAHATVRPAAATPHATHPANKNRMAGRQMSCRQPTTSPPSRCNKRFHHASASARRLIISGLPGVMLTRCAAAELGSGVRSQRNGAHPS